ncbi:MAG: DUF2461 domain-containing protein [Muribaculaceae bacterium]|nr:DUF2461 domain-containing protein [Muribaculaceae bacterium]
MDTQGLYGFLRELSEHNDRAWFAANKERWESLRKGWMDDVDLLLSRMSEWDPSLRHLTAKDCVFRIYRDVRFSANKSPYKTWVCAGINARGKSSHDGGYYIQAGPDTDASYVFSGLFGGVWEPDSATLRKLRKAITDNIEEFRDIIGNEELNRVFPGWVGEQLKTVPKGWPKDHPDADLLRLKEYGKACHCDEAFFSGDWTVEASRRLQLLKPLIDFLNYSIDE